MFGGSRLQLEPHGSVSGAFDRAGSCKLLVALLQANELISLPIHEGSEPLIGFLLLLDVDVRAHHQGSQLLLSMPLTPLELIQICNLTLHLLVFDPYFLHFSGLQSKLFIRLLDFLFALLLVEDWLLWICGRFFWPLKLHELLGTCASMAPFEGVVYLLMHSLELLLQLLVLHLGLV